MTTQSSGAVVFSRAFAIPSAKTFSIPAISDFIRRWRRDAEFSVDPFARDANIADFTNDLDPSTGARWHMEAGEFMARMAEEGRRFGLAYFDPPYSPRQISECYRGVGLSVGREETRNASLYKRVRDALDEVLLPGAIVLSFGWHSNGMGVGRGYRLREVLIVAHGGAHNDTICIAEQKPETTTSALRAREGE